MAGEKTENATPKRKQDERKKGNIFQSKDLTIVFSLLIMFYSLQFLAPTIMMAIEKAVFDFFLAAQNMQTVTVENIQNIALQAMIIIAIAAMPLLLISSLVAILITATQTRLLFTFEAIKFKFSKLNPLEGIKKMFSLRSLVELVKNMLKISVLITILYVTLKDRIGLLPRLMDMEANASISALSELVMAIVLAVGAVFIVIGVFDYAYQWYDYEKNLKMSKQDIKEEYKQTEGDPLIKQKIKERQREAAQRRMMSAVPGADVVIRNPTHYAVAIKYDSEQNSAPKVVAKGADFLALKIIKTAQENGVTIQENKPLARGLYESVELDKEIPESFYQTVAEVLAFVYSMKKRK